MVTTHLDVSLEQCERGRNRRCYLPDSALTASATVIINVVDTDLDVEYAAMAADEAREADALAWSEGTIGDIADVER